MSAEGVTRIDVDAALAMIARVTEPLASETIRIAHANGRVTAAPVVSVGHTPRYRASAMDGFAIACCALRTATVGCPVVLSIGTMVPAGHWPRPLAAGEAVPIATGAPLPDGADAVVAREAVVVTASRLAIGHAINPGHNVRAIGEDCAADVPVLPAGVRIAPDAVGVLAAFGIRNISVRRQPRLGLIATGSELATGAGPLASAAVIDSNTPMIATCATAAGVPCRLIGRAPDCPTSIDALLGMALDPAAGDVILSTGGVSVGDFDLVRRRLEHYGCRILFHGVAMRPGKPLLFAVLPDGRPYFGLPGTPLAALVGFRFFVNTAIRCLLGLPPEAGESVSVEHPGRAGATLFLRGRRGIDSAGRPTIDTGLDQRAHILRSLLDADCWVRLDRRNGAVVSARCYPRQLTLD